MPSSFLQSEHHSLSSSLNVGRRSRTAWYISGLRERCFENCVGPAIETIEPGSYYYPNNVTRPLELILTGQNIDAHEQSETLRISNWNRESSQTPFEQRLRDVVTHSLHFESGSDSEGGFDMVTIKVYRSDELPSAQTWFELRGLTPKHLDVQSFSYEQHFRRSHSSLSEASHFITAVEFPFRHEPVPPLEYLKMEENNAIEMFIDASQHLRLANLCQLILVSNGCDFTRQYDAFDFLAALKKSNAIESLAS
ncbi:hypothetical protein C8J56DRAFT_1048488 [Mycena floridula]|nr:hypothetical protein C8J56DRAFT_1048488 [Mycena floridula]